jgi:Cys-rich repeat protein
VTTERAPRLLALLLPLLLIACSAEELVARERCLHEEAGKFSCSFPACPPDFICHTLVHCGPPVRLEDGGFSEQHCFAPAAPTLVLSGECRPRCESDSDCGSGERCRTEEVTDCSDTSGPRRLCVPK